ncbi:hypothetical protein TWF173_011137 [Orbilia oligospora]|nr:hypothetical protein TWF173_011137 [Orbilia oligospora]
MGAPELHNTIVEQPDDIQETFPYLQIKSTGIAFHITQDSGGLQFGHVVACRSHGNKWKYSLRAHKRKPTFFRLSIRRYNLLRTRVKVCIFNSLSASGNHRNQSEGGDWDGMDDMAFCNAMLDIFNFIEPFNLEPLEGLLITNLDINFPDFNTIPQDLNTVDNIKTMIRRIDAIDSPHTPNEALPIQGGPTTAAEPYSTQTSEPSVLQSLTTDAHQDLGTILESGAPGRQNQPPPTVAPETKPAKRPKSKIHKCMEQDCEFETSCLRIYGMHAKNVHGAKSFKCPDCGTQSARKDNLSSRAHARICKMKQERERAKRLKESQVIEDVDTRTEKRVCLSDVRYDKISPSSRSSTPGTDVSRQLDLPQSEIGCQRPDGRVDENKLVAELKARLVAYEEENKRLKENDRKMLNRLKNIKRKSEEMETELDQARQDRDHLYERCKHLLIRLRTFKVTLSSGLSEFYEDISYSQPYAEFDTNDLNSFNHFFTFNSHTAELTSNNDGSNGFDLFDFSVLGIPTSTSGAGISPITVTNDSLANIIGYDENLGFLPESSQVASPKALGEGFTLEAQHGTFTSPAMASSSTSIGFQVEPLLPSTVTGNQVQGTNSSSIAIPQPIVPTETPKSPVSHSPTSFTPKKRKSKVKRVYTCAIDGFYTTCNRTYGDHMFKNHDIKHFRCETCNFQTARSDNLLIHGRSCKGKQQKAAKIPEFSKRQRVQKRVSLKNLPESIPETLASMSKVDGLVAPLDPLPLVDSSDTALENTLRPRKGNQALDSLPRSQTPRQNSECQLPNLESSTSPAGPKEANKCTSSGSFIIDELRAKIATLEQENTILKQENNTLSQENCTLKAEKDAREVTSQKIEELRGELKQTQFYCDVWQKTCGEMWKVSLQKSKEEP